MDNYLLNIYITSPGALWIVLQLGGQIGAWMVITVLLHASDLWASEIERAGFEIVTTKACIYGFSIVISIFISHALWLKMETDRMARAKKAFIESGEHEDYFLFDKNMNRKRQRYLNRIRRERSRKNRESRRNRRKRFNINNNNKCDNHSD